MGQRFWECEVTVLSIKYLGSVVRVTRLHRVNDEKAGLERELSSIVDRRVLRWL